MSQSTLRTKMRAWPKSEVPMNSASVEDCATVGWSLDLYAIVPPASHTHTPVKDQCVLGHVAQLEST
jgi:hypothetical protein